MCEHCGHSHVFIVESPWSVLRMHPYEMPAVALMAKSLSEEQLRLLMNFRRVLIMLDGGPGGRKRAGLMARRLANCR